MARADIGVLLAQRHANGGDHWASADGRWGVGSPFSTLDCGLMLAELGLKAPDPVARGIADLVFACQTDDGRIRPGPHLGVQPCHTGNATRLLCHLGYARDSRLALTFDHLLRTQAADGGWRCSVLKFGASPDTDASNPGVTLGVLDALRFRKPLTTSPEAERAVDTLLEHWSIRRPLGPCRFGIGSRFMRVEYPFLRYNLFSYVYILSFYPHAHRHPAFLEALETLRAKLVDGQVVIEHQNPGLKALQFCRAGAPSAAATRRWRDVLRNLKQ
ncbi:MAG: prenyltransferase [Devosia nanyangense]|uniref:Prenyltransferase n=1 Tax=Devosia nanyangense TaxID=1228055 RepID=A0A933NYJ7_9HYPH|nr:prenyltransferase [Devosia nanyangense]